MAKLIVLLWIISISVAACAAEMPSGEVPPGARMFLRGSSGPYRGRVIDAKSKQPTVGAIIVAVWYREVDALVQSNTVFYDAIEVVSDSLGYFVVDAPNIERRAPANTQFPVFTIFKPGYTYFEGYFATTDDLFNRKNKALLGTVELESISHLSKREQASKRPPDLRIRRIPSEKIPMFLEALRQSREDH